jgi:hypothetical protein
LVLDIESDRNEIETSNIYIEMLAFLNFQVQLPKDFDLIIEVDFPGTSKRNGGVENFLVTHMEVIEKIVFVDFDGD